MTTAEKLAHTRDTITLLAGLGVGADMCLDLNGHIPGLPQFTLPPSVVAAWPYFLLGTFLFRIAMGLVLRIFNIWFPPTATSTNSPTNP